MKLIRLNRLTTGVILGLVLCSLLSPTLTRAQNSVYPSQSTDCGDRWGKDEACPIRIRFRSGTNGATVYSSLTQTPDVRYYILHAQAGQTMKLFFSSSAGPMRGGIKYPGGSGDGPFSGVGEPISLPETGDYIIYVGQNMMAGEPWMGSFRLRVEIR